MNKWVKGFLSFILAITLAVTSIPTSVFADAQNVTAETEEADAQSEETNQGLTAVVPADDEDDTDGDEAASAAGTETVELTEGADSLSADVNSLLGAANTLSGDSDEETGVSLASADDEETTESVTKSYVADFVMIEAYSVLCCITVTVTDGKYADLKLSVYLNLSAGDSVTAAAEAVLAAIQGKDATSADTLDIDVSELDEVTAALAQAIISEIKGQLETIQSDFIEYMNKVEDPEETDPEGNEDPDDDEDPKEDDDADDGKADDEETEPIAGPTYSISIPSNVSMGTLSTKEDNSTSYTISVEASNLNGSLTIVSEINGSLSQNNGTDTLPFTNSFGTHIINANETIISQIKITAADVKKASAGAYSGSAVFKVYYTAASTE